MSNRLSSCMNKILFLHGFYATGSCPMARALREAFDGQAVVLTPDLPLHPKEALKYIRMLIDKEKPDLLCGQVWGYCKPVWHTACAHTHVVQTRRSTLENKRRCAKSRTVGND